jgi:Endosomal/lysosomal potassium channel TMEM175
MQKGRLEAFTDGVIAIIITIMVLEMKVPHGSDFAALASSAPVFVTYALSYTNVAIFWNNHHHMVQASERVALPLWLHRQVQPRAFLLGQFRSGGNAIFRPPRAPSSGRRSQSFR